MACPIRCYSTNVAIGEYYTVIMEIKKYLHENPPKPGEKTFVDYLNDFGITQYPQTMRIISTVNFFDAHMLNK